MKEGHVLYIACGPYGVGGTGKDGYKEFIGRDRKIIVPHDLWKVILVLPREDAEPHKNTRVISIIMPNDQTVDYDWARYRTSLRKVEELTGNRFFRTVPEDVAEALRDSVDEAKIHVSTPPRNGVGKRRQEEPR